MALSQERTLPLKRAYAEKHGYRVVARLEDSLEALAAACPDAYSTTADDGFEYTMASAKYCSLEVARRSLGLRRALGIGLRIGERLRQRRGVLECEVQRALLLLLLRRGLNLCLLADCGGDASTGWPAGLGNCRPCFGGSEGEQAPDGMLRCSAVTAYLEKSNALVDDSVGRTVAEAMARRRAEMAGRGGAAAARK